MANQFLAAIDQGTTGSTVMIIDVTSPQNPKIAGRSTANFKQHFPSEGWVEHDLDEIWHSVETAFKDAARQTREHGYQDFDLREILAIGITNQRETLCIFDRKTSKPLCRAIVWQCRRSTEICHDLRAKGLGEMIGAKTGLVIDPYFTGTKLAWVMANRSDVAASLKAGTAIVGTIDTYLIHRLSGGLAHVTEASNASRTLLYNIHTGSWDPELLDVMGVPSQSILPEVRDSAGSFGKTLGSFLPDGIPITGVLGDQQAALAGQACFAVGEAKCTYGTGAFLLLNLGKEPLRSKTGMLTTVAWKLNGQLTYAFEGSSFIAGAAVQFLRDQLHFVSDATQTAEIARAVSAAPDIYFVPALTGLGAPYWDPSARGAFLGLTRGTTIPQLVRATLESIALQVADLVGAMREDYPGAWNVLRVDGGAASNDVLMEMQANYALIPVDRPDNLETTAFGAAMFAGLGVGLYRSLDEIRGARKCQRLFNPPTGGQDMERSAAHRKGWKRAVRAVQVFAAE
jgi:glycerol kinase